MEIYRSPDANSEIIWSETFHEFLDLCLHRESDYRANAEDLLKHPFLQKICTLDAVLHKMECVFIGNSLRLNGLI